MTDDRPKFTDLGDILKTSNFGFDKVTGPAGENINVSANLDADVLRTGQTSHLRVTLDLDPGLHVYGPHPVEDYLPTTISVSGPEGMSFGEPRWPDPSAFEMEGEEFEGFEGRVEIVVPVTSMVREEGTADIEVKVGYQACNDNMCFLPKTETLTVSVGTAPNIGTAEPS